MFFLICPQMFGGAYSALSPARQLQFAALFQAGWFIESQWTQTLVIHTLRTEKTPVLQSMKPISSAGFSSFMNVIISVLFGIIAICSL